jgi:Cu(I)/Ag(I) efflux system membrane protein CusA/SilA
MMTVATIILGLLPVLYGEGTGSEVMSRVAAPMVGGMTSAVILTLIVLPALYLLVKKPQVSVFNRRFNSGLNHNLDHGLSHKSAHLD